MSSSDVTFRIDCTSEASTLCARICSGQLQTVKRPHAASHLCDQGSCLQLSCVPLDVGGDTSNKRSTATYELSFLIHVRNIANVWLTELSSPPHFGISLS
jgi:hypothetical protein